jgi:O-antigen ligase
VRESRPSEGGRLRNALRWVVLALLTAAPIAVGAVHAPVYVPLLSACFVVGLLSWARSRWARAHGIDVPHVPARWLLGALLALAVFQLVPLPPGVLARISPGSRSYWDFISLAPVPVWRPISLSPPDTARGAVFLAAFGLFYATVFREFRDPRWRRRLLWTVAGTGVFITVVALIQAASGERRILGLFKPTWDWSVFGTYVNRNHFAGYMALAIPLALGLAAEAFASLRHAMSRRRRSWLALADSPGMSFLRRAALGAAMLVGLVASGSRGGLMAFGVSAAAWPLLRPRRATLTLGAAAGVVAVVVLLPRITSGSGSSAGDPTHRLELWQDVLRMVPDFPVFGAGFNAFGTSYYRYKSIWPGVWFGEAHNEYLQSLADAGVVGALLVLSLVATLLFRAFRSARLGPVETGIACALVAGCAHNCVEFNWQIPANALTFAAIAGLGVQGARRAGSASLDRSEAGHLESTTR